MEPDLRTFLFSARTEVELELMQETDHITLDCHQLAIWDCGIKTEGESVGCPFKRDPSMESVTVILPERIAGRLSLSINYMGHINDQMSGFYRSGYEVGGERRFIAVTQFEESDARKAFPCVDHPVNKATFDVEILIDQGLEAISNCPIIGEEKVEGKRKLVRFQRSPKMSTYLVFFGIGDFEFSEDPGDVTIRLATIRGKRAFAQFGLSFSRKALDFCEGLFEIPYPLPKLDLIAIPDFAFGAMENWGAITFRENLLLHYPDVTSKAAEMRICEVIAHEIVHQWFGNLVSPSDWKFLWLNESFATYIAYGVVSHHHPDWDIWEQFLGGQTTQAFERDALMATFPIELPGGGRIAINASTAPIIYNKGGSILRQIEGYIGKQSFKQGLTQYLKQNAYGSASSESLWQALEEVSEKPVLQMMKSWVEQPGFPMVDVSQDGDRLILAQRRFTYIPNDTKQTWLIPVTIQFLSDKGRSTTKTVILDRNHLSIPTPTGLVAYLVNAGRTGFYRVRYRDENNLNTLGQMVSSQNLSPGDRWGLQNDLYAMVMSGEVSMDEYLRFLAHYRSEDAFLPVSSIADSLYHSLLILDGPAKEGVVSFGKKFVTEVLSRMGHEPVVEERQTTTMLRDKILWLAGLFHSEKAAELLLEKFAAKKSNRPIHPDIVRAVLRVGALHGGDGTYGWLTEKLESVESEHERMDLLVAMGSFGDSALLERSWQYVLERVPQRNKFIALGAMAENPIATPYLWDWFISSLDELEKFHPIHYERVIAGLVPVAGLGKEQEVTAFFQSYKKKEGHPQDVIDLSLETLAIHSRMRAKR
jgi:tricorn protease interacting factor F2/3